MGSDSLNPKSLDFSVVILDDMGSVPPLVMEMPVGLGLPIKTSESLFADSSPSSTDLGVMGEGKPAAKQGCALHLISEASLVCGGRIQNQV